MKTCTKCGETRPLDDFRRERDRAGSWCKSCTSANTRRRQAEYRAETGERYQDRSYPIGECEDCGSPIRLQPARKTMRCRPCSIRATTVARIGRPLAGKELVLYEGEPFQSEPKSLGELPSLERRWYMGFCVYCREPFIHNMPQTNTCSAECKRRIHARRRRARKRDGFVADVSPREIFDRDRWTCQLCGTRVAWSKKAPHPRAPVIDHLVPLAAGRENGGVHAPYNVQCAHFLCNSIKCAEFDQAALF